MPIQIAQEQESLQFKSLLRLWEVEIKKRLAPLFANPESGRILSELLSPSSFIADLANEIASQELDQNDFAEQLWTAIMETPLQISLFNNILIYLHEIEENSKIHYILLESNKKRLTKFRLILENLDDFLKYVITDIVLGFLDTIEVYRDYVKGIRDEFKDRSGELNNELSRQEMSCMLFRTVPLVSPLAMFDFLKGVFSCGNEAAAFVNKLVPGFERQWAQHDAERENPRGEIFYVPIDRPATDLFNNRDTLRRINLNWEDLPTENTLSRRLLHSLKTHMHQESPIILREYQRELCTQALKGENVIIAAPTGSGKTIVAAFIIKSHLDACASTGKYAKILFMTPNAFIIKQQAETMNKFLGHCYEVASACGDDNAPLRELIAAKDVLVATPQLIVNLLNDTLDPRSTFELDKFTMIIFDECHKTDKKDPYNMLMRFYHKAKTTGSYKWYPQIIGLTASLGVGKGSKDDVAALQHIVEICANLDCKEISLVQKNKEELKKFSPVTPDGKIFLSNFFYSNVKFSDLKFVPNPPSGNRFDYITTTAELMRVIEEKIIKNLRDHNVPIAERQQNPSSPDLMLLEMEEGLRTPAKCITQPPPNKLDCEYQNWISEHKNRIVPETSLLSNNMKLRVMEGFKCLDYCFRSVDVHNNLTSDEAFRYLDSRMTKMLAEMTPEMGQIWSEFRVRLNEKKCNTNPMVDALIEELTKQHDEKPDFRVITFVKTRRNAMLLAKLLNEKVELTALGIQSEFIAGLNRSTASSDDSDDDTAVNRNEQQEKLARFKDGQTKVLVATSVAEEGLDIAKCNLVIKYNYATNEIAHVQRRGRGRAEGSKCILITYNLKLKEQEENNVLKERLMNRALNYVQSDKQDLETRVIKQLEELNEGIRREDELAKEKRAKFADKNDKYQILCKKCNGLLTASKYIRIHCKAQYVVAEPEFWKRIRPEGMTLTEQENAKFHLIGKIFCKSENCGECVGRIIIVKSINMPILTAEMLIISDPHGVKRTVKKWKEVTEKYFMPEDLRTVDLKLMQEDSFYPGIQSARPDRPEASVGDFRAQGP
ncbi:hypothetical protein WR25_24597 [Diploscapter pachys]|uniref:RNA helicase n=1 Tax=Diploscapter pachys TaxID=2018661 RepID=A0A2A2JC56_9BILA|nr:hypothetical protein WR25_24597 [Diploscapter pachys]